MRTGEVLAAEALVRWNHPDPRADIARVVHRRRRIHQPGRGIGSLGDAHGVCGVRRLACAGRRAWHRAPHERVACAARHRRIRRLRGGDHGEFGLDRGSICLEITESVVVQDIETTSITLAGLKKAGVQVAIDDFGTGYSVLSHLKSLPVDVLKIDRSFVTDLGSNPDDLAIVRAIIALAEAFGLQLVAEGVETEAAAITLLRHGCHRAQGFLLSPPLSGASWAPYLPRGESQRSFPQLPAPDGKERVSRMASCSCRPEAVHTGRPGPAVSSSSIRRNRLAPVPRRQTCRSSEHGAAARRSPRTNGSLEVTDQSEAHPYGERAVRRGKHDPDDSSVVEDDPLQGARVVNVDVAFAYPVDHPVGERVVTGHLGGVDRSDGLDLQRLAVAGAHLRGSPSRHFREDHPVRRRQALSVPIAQP